ncbi:LysM peptidoglycan-binding domain-containing protein [Aliivibrio sp. SR45-2]|uniref:MIX and LysM peptidoglycan-binding domain-containing protein n=1 Tax=Aliivibrio sp. SR45-2 TaxID=2760931 RepID=UPI0015FB4ABB|nr:LysM peptidoglycan-binding domain-containing protein [Aliivibrio sp. SR45-2]MBB1312506.1 LysM peptidoglycan-binding domain-containing protein [Aliivibrio sp. SR45-2]
MKVWDEKVEKFVESVDEDAPKFVRAHYSWNEELAREAKVDVPHYEAVKEILAKTAAFEYSIEIACTKDELNTYQVGVFSLGKTKEEANISSWNKTQTEKGFTLLTASVNVNEPKTLNREFFISSGTALSFDDVQPVEQGAGTHTESFIPVKPAVQVGERLGWPTEGYFYHFVDDALTHEYKLMGDGKWAFQVTRTTDDSLTDELVSDHQYSFILLPWKINNTVVTRQHLLYLPQKMTAQQLEELTADWLNENGCLLDVNEIADTRKEKAAEREKVSNDDLVYAIQSGDTLSGIAEKKGLTLSQLVMLNPQYKGQEDHIKIGDNLVLEVEKERKTLPPVDVTKEKTVFSWENLWSDPQSPIIHPVVATLHKMDSIPKNTPVINVRAKKHGINPDNMYWPAYDFTKEGDERYLNVEYTQNVVKFAVLSPEEWAVFFDSFGKFKTLKDGVTGLYDARETAKALGGIGVTVLVRTVDGVDYVILKNYDKWKQTLLYGGVFKANNSKIIKLGLGGLDTAKGMAKFVRVTAPLEILVGTSINVLQFILNDEYTLSKLGVDEAKLFVHVLVVSGVAFIGISLAAISAPVTVSGGLILYAVSGVAVSVVDWVTDFEKGIVESVIEVFDSE